MPRPGDFAVLGPERLEARFIHRQALLAGQLDGQRQGEAVGLEQVEGLFAGDLRSRRCFSGTRTCDHPHLDLLEAALQGGLEAGLFLLQLGGDRLARPDHPG
jgi:hypothetical protein